MTSTAAPASATGASAPGQRPVESRDPATGEVWKRFEPVTTQQVAEALAAARRAQPAWAARPMAERAAILRRFHDILFERRHDVASCISRENGKPPAEALAEAVTTLDFADFYSRRRVLRTLEPRWHRASTMSMLRKRILVTHEPFGVVGVIGPWNYPFMLIAAVTLPALVSGNAALIKPSEFTPQC
ncbi:MAG TPA: aldehyde dehydrogenase family protein, partial [Gemmatimonadaceae bacterium]|nr:aldehyde dehydrogenase family protein [Gemmatimonadaceae bacterium]